LAVEVREASGKGVARKLRAAGRIPGVCYGRNTPSMSVMLDPHALEHLIATSEAGINTLIDLKVDGGGAFDGRKVLVKELQRDPVNGALLHADLFAVDLEQTVTVAVPIHVTGTPEGVKMGGILDQSLRELEFECLPQAIPREISLDVSALEVGQSLHVRDLTLPEGVTLMSDPDLSVVSVVAPAVVAEEVPAEEEAAAEEAVEGEAPAEEAAEAEKTEESGDS
jgi:large subunit ribosomal protein L25